jgi:hypothetical protein
MSTVLVSRRLFLAGGITLNAATLPLKNEIVYGFATTGCDVQMTVAFYDRYSSDGFWFKDHAAGRPFCLSAAGEQNHNCPARFTGSLAVARYRFQPRIAALREHVRTIDQDTRLNHRPPFDRVIEPRRGIATDIQAFGYETPPPPASASAHEPESGGPWYYFRQELFLPGQTTPFLVVHWRHAFGAIRMLDVIPGDGTSPVKRSVR